MVHLDISANIPYLLNTDDQMIEYWRQVKLVEDAKSVGAVIPKVKRDASHSLCLSQPELNVKVIRRAAGEDVV